MSNSNAPNGSAAAFRLEATHLRDRRWAVRPEGCLGTCGWLTDGRAWQVVYVTASSADQARRRATPRIQYDMEVQG